MDPLAPTAGTRVLFALTHPDDEIAVCCAIRAACRAGAEVSLSWTHHTGVRRLEAERFAEVVGVPADRRYFHGASDGDACDEMPLLRPRFEAMMEAARPEIVVCGAFEQGHLDHDATNLLVRRTFGGRVVEAPFYHAYVTRLQRIGRFAGSGGPECVRDLDEDERRFKLAVAKGYPSQSIYRLALLHEARERLCRRPATLLHVERYREGTHADPRVPNHDGPLRARIERHPKWARWLAAVERFDGG